MRVTRAAERKAEDEASETKSTNHQSLLWPEKNTIIFDDQKVTDMSGKDSADHINSCNYLRWGMRSRMPVRMVSTMANWESRPKVKSMAKKRIAHNVGNGNRVTRSG